MNHKISLAIRAVMTNADSKATIDTFFHPKSVAVIGASPDETAFGTRYLNTLIKFGYIGKLFPVNHRGEQVLGLSSAFRLYVKKIQK